jgi:hypothetical protein
MLTVSAAPTTVKARTESQIERDSAKTSVAEDVDHLKHP